jgi:hypothetical protein
MKRAPNNKKTMGAFCVSYRHSIAAITKEIIVYKNKDGDLRELNT